jgi:hypothetical protein
MFSLELQTGNAAFCSPTTGEPSHIFEAQEVASILRYVADKIDDGFGENRSGSCIDANGNNVGSWKFQ